MEGLEKDDKEEAVVGEQGEPEELESEEEEEEFEDRGDVDDEEFKRRVIEIPPIVSLMSEEEEDVAEGRFVDFYALIEDSEEEGVDGGEVEDMDIEEEEEEEPEVEEHEIDGVGMIVKIGQNGGGKGQRARRTVYSVIESMQAKAGQMASGYDENDPFIDDADLVADNPAGELDQEKHEYKYSDFYIAEFKAKQAPQQKKVAKALKPLSELSPPPTEELKAAIASFRQKVKSMSEAFEKAAATQVRFRLPPELDADVLRLGRAIEQWHPRRHLPEELFEYVLDVLPENVQSVKARAKTLMDKANEVPDSNNNNDNVNVGLVEDSSTRKRVLALPIPTLPEGVVRLEDIQALIASMLVEQKQAIETSKEGNPVLRFKYNDKLLGMLEAHRQVIAREGNKAVHEYYKYVTSCFPEDLMSSARVSQVIAAFRKRLGKSANASSSSTPIAESSLILFDDLDDVVDDEREAKKHKK